MIIFKGICRCTHEDIPKEIELANSIIEQLVSNNLLEIYRENYHGLLVYKWVLKIPDRSEVL